MSAFRLFPFLRWKIDKSFALANSSYKRYYDEHVSLFDLCPELKKYDLMNEPFALIKASIVLKGLQSKKLIEDSAELYQETNLSLAATYNTIHERLPYMEEDGEKIFLPFFSPVYNRPYDRKLSSLLKPPFSLLRTNFGHECIDPFNTYGFRLFDSFFTDLILIGKSSDQGLAAFYSIDLETVFVIDDQGTLEEMIPLFDTPLIDRRKDHLFPRLQTLMGFYFSMDKESFIDSLFNLHFISQKTYQFILESEGKKEKNTDE
jgi:hypothetical protein